ncbi:uncharacterized protein AKAW2_80174S [Aspergillus luchuensis]|uniref:Uncharacterized protein n=1 Tax=Aspergillus kawachii TaxID=1069201 RepID=A0A7R8A4Y5_ASPKA|nr:uncharacterized protein AKAW2_80174S [Aspergillus luchuensis]BCS04373.1 hypothetical protein AKAW2_80174S [Aspergillus luchuensis]
MPGLHRTGGEKNHSCGLFSPAALDFIRHLGHQTCQPEPPNSTRFAITPYTTHLTIGTAVASSHPTARNLLGKI